MSDINNPEVSLASLRITAQEMRDRIDQNNHRLNEAQLRKIYTTLRSIQDDYSQSIGIDPPRPAVLQTLVDDGYEINSPRASDPNKLWHLSWSKKR